MSQRWTELAYFHWPYDPAVVQALLPTGARVDTFDERAWVGLVPFVMRDVRLGPLPSVPFVGSFVEINVRTYVIDATGRRLVWFFSLDVPRSLIVAVARTAFLLPYCWSRTRFEADGATRRYRMARRWPRTTDPTVADIEFEIADPIEEPTELDHFLTARWGLLTAGRKYTYHGAVDHERWPLRRIGNHRVVQSVVEAAGLPTPEGPTHTMCAQGVSVRVGRLRRVGRAVAVETATT